MISYSNFYDNKTISRLIQVGTASGYLQGAGYQVSFKQREQSFQENVYAFLKFSDMQVDAETASRIVSGEDLHCAHKKLQSVLSIIKGYRKFIKFMEDLDINTTPDSIIDFFIELNHSLQVVGDQYQTAYSPGIRENTQKLLIEILSPYFQRRVATSYVEIPLFFNRIFNEYSNPGYAVRKVSKELVLFMTLFLLFREEPCMLHIPVGQLVDTIKKDLDKSQDFFINSFVGILHEILWPLACSLYSQRKALEVDLKSPTRKTKRLLSAMQEKVPIRATEIMKQLGLEDSRSFRRHYLKPALLQGFIEKVLLGANTSPYQAYIITEKGLSYMAEMKTTDLRIIA